MLNRCEFIGRLGKSPEQRAMQDGNKVVNLSLGVTETWKKKDGTRGERTEWVRVVVFNEGIANIIMQHVGKGDLIRIVGAMQTRKWQDQSGNDKYSTEITLQKYRGELTLLGSKKNADDNQGGDNYSGNSSGGAADMGGDIPF